MINSLLGPKAGKNDSPTVKRKSEGPNPSFANFWQMIWDNKISLIVMLCPIIGLKGNEESCVYWDQIFQDCQHRVIVKSVLETTTPTPGVTRRIFLLQKRENADDGEVKERTIEHY